MMRALTVPIATSPWNTLKALPLKNIAARIHYILPWRPAQVKQVPAFPAIAFGAVKGVPDDVLFSPLYGMFSQIHYLVLFRAKLYILPAIVADSKAFILKYKTESGIRDLKITNLSLIPELIKKLLFFTIK